MLLFIIVTHSSRLIAATVAIFFVPYDTFILGMSFTSEAIPASIGSISTFALSAIIHTVDFFSKKLLATVAVTSLPHCEMPSETTPLSAHIITSAFLSNVKSLLPFTPAIWVIVFSSLPKENKGLTTESQRFSASDIASSSNGFIFSNSLILIISHLYIFSCRNSFIIRMFYFFHLRYIIS